MPLLQVTVTAGSFAEEGKQRLVQGLTDAACRAESVPDEPLARARAVLIWDSLAPGAVFWVEDTVTHAIRDEDSDDQLICRVPAPEHSSWGKRVPDEDCPRPRQWFVGN